MKPYYTSRFVKALGFPGSEREDVKQLLSRMEALKSLKIVFRNGYSASSPSFIADCYISIGQGKQEWGAEPGKDYYVLKINAITKQAEGNG